MAAVNNFLLFSAISEIIDDDQDDFEFLEAEDDITIIGVAVPFMRRDLNRMEGFFTVTVPRYSLDEFKGHFRMTRETCERLVQAVLATGHIPIANRFGRKKIEPSKQVLIYIWCMANQEVTRLVADRFNVTYSSVTRVLHRITAALLSLKREYIKWPNSKCFYA